VLVMKQSFKEKKQQLIVVGKVLKNVKNQKGRARWSLKSWPIWGYILMGLKLYIEFFVSELSY